MRIRSKNRAACRTGKHDQGQADVDRRQCRWPSCIAFRPNFVVSPTSYSLVISTVVLAGGRSFCLLWIYLQHRSEAARPD